MNSNSLPLVVPQKFTLGQKVKIATRLSRAYEETEQGVKCTWITLPLPASLEGIIVRRVSKSDGLQVPQTTIEHDGDYGTEYEWYPPQYYVEKWIKAYEVAYDVNCKPFLVAAVDIEAAE